jgi:sporulation protein YlmC with PRC-barrel domain
MSKETQLQIGSDVLCVDGVVGDLTRVVIDPVGQVLTHLVVEPAHRSRPGRLVPIGLVVAAGDVISLGCTVAQFEGLEDAEETQFLPGAEESWGYQQEHMLSWPYYGLAAGRGMGLGMAVGSRGGGRGGRGADDLAHGPQLVTHDRVPLGEVEVRRGERVHAADGDIGKVRGLLLDPADQHVTHFLLDEGHLWGKKLVAIPITVVTSVEHGVQLKITKGEVRDLPRVEFDGVE